MFFFVYHVQLQVWVFMCLQRSCGVKNNLRQVRSERLKGIYQWEESSFLLPSTAGIALQQSHNGGVVLCTLDKFLKRQFTWNTKRRLVSPWVHDISLLFRQWIRLYRLYLCPSAWRSYLCASLVWIRPLASSSQRKPSCKWPEGRVNRRRHSFRAMDIKTSRKRSTAWEGARKASMWSTARKWKVKNSFYGSAVWKQTRQQKKIINHWLIILTFQRL